MHLQVDRRIDIHTTRGITAIQVTARRLAAECGATPDSWVLVCARAGVVSKRVFKLFVGASLRGLLCGGVKSNGRGLRQDTGDI